ncbi:hypothetical protein GCM10010116_25270 [Microbispora rosea subsp. aerata]|nr:DUF742 domain-containing protein [Microbispora rosea]GGO12582.1 hypothetical protein GCM10010116_25270 [Microbispora rosea subsp. aerata]GIH54089.1 hypothetical protein Mro02_10030 [Microbispora rosea subsp. aerata]GLJ85062.1 hypothetical protein GCM10017588_37900 [Microbispora rosea subsp. aerata]
MTGPQWMDEEAGPLVRPYALTGGRARHSGAKLDLITMVTTSGSPQDVPDMGPEQRRILEIARRGASVADIASELDLPLGVVRVLIGDLHDLGLVSVRAPGKVAPLPSERILKEVINGLRAL